MHYLVTYPKFRLFIIAVLGIFLSGCVPLIVAGTATTITVAHDRRDTKTIFDDKTITLQSQTLLGRSDIRQQVQVNITSYNNNVLLTGQAQTIEDREEVIELVKTVDGVRTIYNEIAIGDSVPFFSRTNDAWLTTRVKTAMVANDMLDASRVKVVSENKVVYLMGLVNPEEANEATNVARRVSGVEKVVRVFEYIPDTETDA